MSRDVKLQRLNLSLKQKGGLFLSCPPKAAAILSDSQVIHAMLSLLQGPDLFFPLMGSGEITVLDTEKIALQVASFMLAEGKLPGVRSIWVKCLTTSLIGRVIYK